VLQSSLFDGLAFDPFALKQNGVAASEVDVGGREVRGGSGNLHSGAEWSFCLMAARMAADQER